MNPKTTTRCRAVQLMGALTRDLRRRVPYLPWRYPKPLAGNLRRKIVLLDSSISATNLGNKIIMESVEQTVREMFPHDFIYNVPMMEYIDYGKPLVRDADYIFVAGTNALSNDMNCHGNWRMRARDLLWMKNIILLGVGWWQYEEERLAWSTRYRLKHVLSQSLHHSVRDSYTLRKLEALGIKAINCGCPTIWSLSDELCATIPVKKATAVLLTFTDYAQTDADCRNRRTIYEIARRNYDRILFWPQAHADVRCARDVCGAESGVEFVDPSLQALDECLKRPDVDYVGTRLHAGIRALQHRCRTIIVATDNRASEMGLDFNLPVIPDSEITRELEARIRGSWPTRVRLHQNAITTWKAQFAAPALPPRRDGTETGFTPCNA